MDQQTREEPDHPLSEDETQIIIQNAQVLLQTWRAMPKRAFAHPWERFGAGCITRASGTLDSILRLNNDSADCATLARSLFEHVVAFAWMAAEPEVRLEMLLRKNANEVRKTASELIALRTVTLDPSVLATAERQSFGEKAPGVADQAVEADAFWSVRVPGWSWGFRRSYTSMYRSYSMFVHPSNNGIATLFEPHGSVDVRKCDAPVGHVRAGAALCFADGLVVASETLAWPRREHIAD
jgi:hypothetical protein